MEDAAQIGKQTESNERNGPPTILLVDSDPQLLTKLANGLHEHGLQTISASDSESAMTMLESCKPDMVILDFDLPGKTALALARLISESDLSFMFLSASSDESCFQEAMNLGAMGFLLKPIDPIHIALSIHAGLRIATTIHQLRDQSSKLSTLLHADRDVSVVTGLVMDRLAISQVQAYDALRQCARNRHRAIKELSKEILDCAATLGDFLAEIRGLVPVRKKQGGGEPDKA
jgi:two-component system, response regulator PdtaR